MVALVLMEGDIGGGSGDDKLVMVLTVAMLVIVDMGVLERQK